MDDSFPHGSIKSAILEISSELRRLSIDTMLLPDEIIDVFAMGDIDPKLKVSDVKGNLFKIHKAVQNIRDGMHGISYQLNTLSNKFE